MNRLTLCIIVALLILTTAQPALAIEIPGDGSGEGTYYDIVNGEYVLKQDVSEAITITSDEIILDGATHTVTGSGSGFGIKLVGKTGVTIKNLTVQNFSSGIYLASYSNGNNLTDNTISGNARGIHLHTSCEGNTLKDNTISGNSWGINLYASCNENVIRGNTIEYNLVYGIILEVNSNQNEIYNNNFISNPTQTFIVNSTGNVFNLDIPIGGNYWSDYNGEDTDSDGIGDTLVPYLDLDNYPWVIQDGWSPEALIKKLIFKVEELNLQNGINNNLDAKLQNALDALEAKNAGQRQDAINKMQAFVNAVEAQSGDKIPVEAADELIAIANYIISLL